MSALQTSDPEGARRSTVSCSDGRRSRSRWAASRARCGGCPGYLGGEPHQPVPRDVVAVMVPLGGEEQSQWSVDFWIDDADAAAAKAPELGGAVLAPARDTGGFRQAV